METDRRYRTRRRSQGSSVRRNPTLDYERLAWRAGRFAVAGVDEAGRGAWAGPLVAAATILPAEPALRARLTRKLRAEGLTIRDSKQLQHHQRVRIAEIAGELGISTATVAVEAFEVDRLGLGVANCRALERAVRDLTPSADHVLVDAFRLDDCAVSHEPIIGGDQCSLTVALASIVAKAHRDLIMIALDERYPDFGFASHKGYGTVAHARALERYGPTPQHRQCFAPVARCLGDSNVQI